MRWLVLGFYREILWFLSTATAVGWTFSQIKSAGQNYFPGETKAPPCFQLYSEISGCWRGGKKIINLFFDRTSKCSWFLRSKSCVYFACIYLDFFYLMSASDILDIYGCICFVWLSKEEAIWYCQCYWITLPERKGDFCFSSSMWNSSLIKNILIERHNTLKYIYI